MTSIPLKYCFRCKLDLPITAFGRNRSERDGLQSECRSCRSIQKRLKRADRPSRQVMRDENSKCCVKCKKWFPLTPQFFGKQTHNPDGFANLCRTCKAEQDALYRQSEKGKEIIRRNRISSIGKMGNRRRGERFSKTEKGRQRAREAARKARLQTPEKVQARKEVHKAVQRHEIPPAKELPCVKCGNPAHHYHHYLGYESRHWFDVVPLCRKCHFEVHKNKRSDSEESTVVT